MFENIFKTLQLIFNQFSYSAQHKLGFQAPATLNFERIIDLHHFICFYLIIILMIVLWLLITLIDNFSFFYNVTQKNNILNKEEIIFKYTTKIFKAFKFHSYELINFFNYSNEKVNNLRVNTANAKEIIGLNEHFNLYIKTSMLYLIASTGLNTQKFVDNKFLEFSWTVLPCFVLASISIPSFYILYINEEIVNPGLTVNIMSHQWYWSYDYTDLYPYWYNQISNDVDLDDFIIESYMEHEKYLNLELGSLRLLETEEPLILPIRLHVRLVVSSFDVLHSFAIPSMGIKVDAIPGRMNQFELFIKRAGVFFGQCSEICGIGHGFMPIELHTVSPINFFIGPVN